MELDPEEKRVVLVDGEDNALGVEGVLASHAVGGLKHRAFTAILLDAQGDVVLARRAPEKLLWPGYWDATVASHPRPERGYAEEGQKRLVEELGVTCDLFACGRFDYDLTFLDVGTESEVCCTLVGQLGPEAVLKPEPGEVSEVRTLSLAALLSEIQSDPDPYCPWAHLAFLCIRKYHAQLPRELAERFELLLSADADAVLRRAIDAHFPERTWRLLSDEAKRG